ncbi:hypothetical protein OBBRIDRAFT_806145 [Obba rivulosa]|uniref:Uncharacterized protein n=1 Tax=Obba rivulosa TaxID=1052685 RepID=A0A8E2ASF4_9APHY|nr:hypothetical protein OBBRIDRAFT_806145 [Obba rivulosa]
MAVSSSSLRIANESITSGVVGVRRGDETVDTASESGLSRGHVCEVDEMQVRRGECMQDTHAHATCVKDVYGWRGHAREVNRRRRARGTRPAGTMTPTSCGAAGREGAGDEDGRRRSMRIGAPCTRQPSDVHAGRQMCARDIGDVRDTGSDGSGGVRMSGGGGSARFGSVMYHMRGVRQLFYTTSNPQGLNVRDRSNKASATKAEAARQHKETYKTYSMSTRTRASRVASSACDAETVDMASKRQCTVCGAETVDTASESGLSRGHVCEVDEMQARQGECTRDTHAHATCVKDVYGWWGHACEVNRRRRARGTRPAGTITLTSCGAAGTWWAEHEGVNTGASTEGARAPETKTAGTGMLSMRISAPCTWQPSDMHARWRMCARDIGDVRNIGSDGSSGVRMSGGGGSAHFRSVMYHMRGARHAWRAVHLRMKSAICVDIYIPLWNQVNWSMHEYTSISQNFSYHDASVDVHLMEHPACLLGILVKYLTRSSLCGPYLRSADVTVFRIST